MKFKFVFYCILLIFISTVTAGKNTPSFFCGKNTLPYIAEITERNELILRCSKPKCLKSIIQKSALTHLNANETLNFYAMNFKICDKNFTSNSCNGNGEWIAGMNALKTQNNNSNNLNNLNFTCCYNDALQTAKPLKFIYLQKGQKVKGGDIKINETLIGFNYIKNVIKIINYDRSVTFKVFISNIPCKMPKIRMHAVKTFLEEKENLNNLSGNKNNDDIDDNNFSMEFGACKSDNFDKNIDKQKKPYSKLQSLINSRILNSHNRLYQPIFQRLDYRKLYQAPLHQPTDNIPIQIKNRNVKGNRQMSPLSMPSPPRNNEPVEEIDDEDYSVDFGGECNSESDFEEESDDGGEGGAGSAGAGAGASGAGGAGGGAGGAGASGAGGGSGGAGGGSGAGGAGSGGAGGGSGSGGAGGGSGAGGAGSGGAGGGSGGGGSGGAGGGSGGAGGGSGGAGGGSGGAGGGSGGAGGGSGAGGAGSGGAGAGSGGAGGGSGGAGGGSGAGGAGSGGAGAGSGGAGGGSGGAGGGSGAGGAGASGGAGAGSGGAGGGSGGAGGGSGGAGGGSGAGGAGASGAGGGASGAAGGAGAGAGACFSGDTMVNTLHGKTKRMDELTVGDWIFSVASNGKTGFSQVLSWLHRMPSIEYGFLKFTFENGKILKITKKHYIYRVNCFANETIINLFPLKPILAEELQTSDCLLSVIHRTKQPLKIIKIETIQEKGIYAPLTDNGNIIVNDIFASCSSEVDNFLSSYILSTLNNHFKTAVEIFEIYFYSIFQIQHSNIDLIPGIQNLINIAKTVI